ncbi:MAG: hypothetical protein Q4F94_07525 [Dialister sp.]|nr:hypothetical protein [Dialister sp.]
MPSNQTPNYALSQWEKTDRVLLEHFHSDNAKTDAPNTAEADARAALSGQLAGKGNCSVYLTSYVGTGASGYEAPNSLTLPVVPAVVFIYGYEGTAVMMQGFGKYSVLYSTAVGGGQISWPGDGKTLSWYSGNPNSQMNMSGETYRVVALYIA